jgi:Asp/Glu/hydantoin racemase
MTDRAADVSSNDRALNSGGGLRRARAGPGEAQHGRRVFNVRTTPFYGAPVGILTIDSSEPFIPGDVGNASTFPFPVRYARVEGCTIERLLFAGDAAALVGSVIDTARKLVAEGAQAIASNCGFMLWFQRAVADALDVPVLLSGLLQLRLIEQCVPAERPIGVLTASSVAMTDELLALTGVSRERLVVAGLDQSAPFRKAFLDEGGVLDVDAVEDDVMEAAASLADQDVAAIAIECAALPPYAAAMQARTRLPVFDEVTLIEYWYRSMFRTPYSGHF